MPLKITTAKQDGTVARWGLIAHASGVSWALWQNEATLVDDGHAAVPPAGTGGG